MRSLLSTISTDLTLTPLQLEAVKRIDAEDFTGVIRKVREEFDLQELSLSDDDAEEMVLALKQYYVVALLDPLNEHAVPKELDPAWHGHILHTKQYMSFCDEAFGEYLHHQPLNHADTDAVDHIDKLYEHTSATYQKMFSYVNRRFFPVTQARSDLVCSHQFVSNPQVRANALFPANPNAQPLQAAA